MPIATVGSWVAGGGALIALYLVLSKADAFNTITTGVASGFNSLAKTLQGR